jgi:hypothetical protein
MIIGTVIQQPKERLDYDLLYEAFFYTYSVSGSPDSIKNDSTGLVASVFPVGATAVVLRLGDDRAKVWLTGGVSGTTYTVTVTMTSVSTRIKEDEILLIVEEF